MRLGYVFLEIGYIVGRVEIALYSWKQLKGRRKAYIN